MTSRKSHSLRIRAALTGETTKAGLQFIWHVQLKTPVYSPLTKCITGRPKLGVYSVRYWSKAAAGVMGTRAVTTMKRATAMAILDILLNTTKSRWSAILQAWVSVLHASALCCQQRMAQSCASLWRQAPGVHRPDLLAALPAKKVALEEVKPVAIYLEKAGERACYDQSGHERERDRGDASQSESVEPANRGPRLLPQLPVQPRNPGSQSLARPPPDSFLAGCAERFIRILLYPVNLSYPGGGAYFLTRRRHHVIFYTYSKTDYRSNTDSRT